VVGDPGLNIATHADDQAAFKDSGGIPRDHHAGSRNYGEGSVNQQSPQCL
jgi:hypothetical protein